MRMLFSVRYLRKFGVKYYPKLCTPVIVRNGDKFLFVVLSDKQKGLVSAPSAHRPIDRLRVVRQLEPPAQGPEPSRGTSLR